MCTTSYSVGSTEAHPMLSMNMAWILFLQAITISNFIVYAPKNKILGSNIEKPKAVSQPTFPQAYLLNNL